MYICSVPLLKILVSKLFLFNITTGLSVRTYRYLLWRYRRQNGGASSRLYLYLFFLILTAFKFLFIVTFNEAVFYIYFSKFVYRESTFATGLLDNKNTYKMREMPELHNQFREI